MFICLSAKLWGKCDFYSCYLRLLFTLVMIPLTKEHTVTYMVLQSVGHVAKEIYILIVLWFFLVAKLLYNSLCPSLRYGCCHHCYYVFSLFSFGFSLKTFLCLFVHPSLYICRCLTTYVLGKSYHRPSVRNGELFSLIYAC